MTSANIAIFRADDSGQYQLSSQTGALSARHRLVLPKLQMLFTVYLHGRTCIFQWEKGKLDVFLSILVVKLMLSQINLKLFIQRKRVPYRNLSYKALKFAMVLASLDIHGINGSRRTLVFFE